MSGILFFIFASCHPLIYLVDIHKTHVQKALQKYDVNASKPKLYTSNVILYISRPRKSKVAAEIYSEKVIAVRIIFI